MWELKTLQHSLSVIQWIIVMPLVLIGMLEDEDFR